jgi:hypothetical protein
LGLCLFTFGVWVFLTSLLHGMHWIVLNTPGL